MPKYEVSSGIDSMSPTMTAIHASNPNSVPGRIIIRGTSKLSLKDRFERLSSELQIQQTARHASERAISAANKRLAQDLGNNPEVVAALHAKRKPVFQRLGVKTRLGIPNNMFQQGYQRNGFSPFRRGYNRNFSGGQFGYYNNMGYRRPRNFGPIQNRLGSSPGGFGFRRGGFQKRFRGGGGPRRFGQGGRGRRGAAQNDRLSREELDRQLDEYMSKTKANLDDELNSYMGEATI